MTAGGSEAAPINSVLPAWDIAAGLTTALGILGAERRRHITGEGQLVTLTLSDVAFAMLGNLGFFGDAQINGNLRKEDGNYIYGTFGRDFGTSDGRRIMVTSFTLRHWQALCEACQLWNGIREIEKRRGVSLNNEGERYLAREEIAMLVATWTDRHTLEQVRQLFDAAGVCWGIYQDSRELVAGDPRCSTQNPMFREVVQPGIGKMTVPGSPLDFNGVDRGAFIAPRSGEHTDTVLAEVLHLSSKEIGKLHDRRIISGSD